MMLMKSNTTFQPTPFYGEAELGRSMSAFRLPFCRLDNFAEMS